jgi:homoserine dehydrogenase
MALRIGIVGFGTVGGAVGRLLTSGTHPSLRLARVCGRANGRGRPGWLPASVAWTTRFDGLLQSDIDVVVELVGGLQPAKSWAQQALLAGKSVVTANKQLVAEHGPELVALADDRRRAFRYEAAVAGGVPVIRAIQDGLAGDRLVSLTGILNGTCNYILTRIEEAGLSFSAALREAQERGYAEADPSADIEGFDARAKLAILCDAAFGVRVPTAEIACGSISPISVDDLARARRQGCTIRQVASATRVEGAPHRVRAWVGPAFVPLDSPLARAQGCQNAVLVRGEYGGETLFAGQGAGGNATAVAVVSDLVAIERARRGADARPAATAADLTRRRKGTERFLATNAKP